MRSRDVIFKILYRLNFIRLLKFLDRDFDHNLDPHILQTRQDSKTIVFCGPMTPWGTMHQRPQNFAKSLAKKGYEVIYCIDPYNIKLTPDRNVKGLFTVNGVALFSTLRNWHERINKIDYIYTCYPWHLDQLKHLKRKFPEAIHIHDVFDDISVFSEEKTNLEKYRQLLEESNKCIYSADALVPKFLINQELLYVPNGCDIEHFQADRGASSAIYVGAIDVWFDFEFMTLLVSKCPDSTFFLVGPCSIKVKDKLNQMLSYSNVFYAGTIEYRKLPYLIARFDYGLIPFKINTITKATSPIKMFEYLAAGVTVISTELPEVKKFSECTFIVKDGEQASRVMHDRLGKSKDVVADVLSDSDWDSRVNDAFK